MKKNFSRVIYTKGRLKMGYTYKISAQNQGGERTTGTIDKEIAEWWLKNENDDFELYFMHEYKTHDSDDGWGHIPEEYRLRDGPWYEDYADIFHGDNCEYYDENTFITISTVAGNEKKNVFGEKIYEEDIEIKCEELRQENTSEDEYIDPKIYEKIDGEKYPRSLYLVHAQRMYKGVWDFEEFTIDKKLNPKNLIMITKEWSNQQVITGFKYRGKEIGPSDSDGDHKGDWAWIES